MMLKEEKKQLENLVMKGQEEITAIRMPLVTELCPHCEKEITIEWDVKKEGYRTFCPNCGNRLMLCGECMDDGLCDYNPEEDVCCRLVEEMWEKLEDIPLNFDGDGREYFEDEFHLCGHKFPAGMEKKEIWAWFCSHHPKGIGYLMSDFE